MGVQPRVFPVLGTKKKAPAIRRGLFSFSQTPMLTSVPVALTVYP